MHKVVLGIAITFTLVSTSLHPQSILTCGTPSDPMGLTTGYARSARELENLKTAPHAAYRSGKHTLVIRWQRGNRSFRDQPPYTAELDGVHWSYCGFNSFLKMHLIGKQDVDVLTGVLLNDSTGAMFAAGETVLFSPSAKYYLAYEQPDGQDGATIRLYDVKGGLLWKGFNRLLSADGKNIVADFESVSWTKDDKLIAEYEDRNNRHKVILTRDKEGNWGWRE
jgi:hypothetical protein